MEFKKFSYQSLDELKDDIQAMHLDLHLSGQLEILMQPVKLKNIGLPNAMAIHPMEGCDGEADGSPGELTKRRYARFAASGAGLLWFEAVSVVPEGRANPRQLWIRRENLSSFQRLMDDMEKTFASYYGASDRPALVMQLTHSGRFSKPYGKPEPVIACHDPYLDKAFHIDPDYPVISDEELEKLEEKFEEAAVLAQKAGFHGVDVKCCHRYLNSELLSSHTRGGMYGGDFEGRTRFLKNVIKRIKSRLGSSFLVTTRLNIYDGIPYPYGWGVDREDYKKADFTEPLRLAAQLQEEGIDLLNVTMGTPYYNPHVNRPYDKGGYEPPEHPLEGVVRLVNGAGIIQKACPGLHVVGTGYSWFRQFAPYLAAGCMEKGLVSIVGFGREAFAYPDFAKDILEQGGMKREKCCITCGKCTEIMRAGGTPGCPVRDTEVYGPIYRQFCKG